MMLTGGIFLSLIQMNLRSLSKDFKSRNIYKYENHALSLVINAFGIIGYAASTGEYSTLPVTQQRSHMREYTFYCSCLQVKSSQNFCVLHNGDYTPAFSAIKSVRCSKNRM
jgi:hypothetical protein